MKIKKITAYAVVLLLLGSVSFYGFNKSTQGIAGYYVWRALSGQANGGHHIAPNGVELYYETFGYERGEERGEAYAEEPPVLVLHGGACFIEVMHNQITVLAQTRHVIALDMRGHGRSRDGVGPLSYAGIAEDVLGLLDHLGVKRVDVVGWGDGGSIGLYLAIYAQDRIGKIVTMASLYDHRGTKPEFAVDLYNPESSLFDEAQQAYKLLSPTPEAWPVFLRKMIHVWKNTPQIPEAQLTAIASPVLVMAGEYDEVVKGEHSAKMARLIPNAELLTIAGANHYLPLESPEAVNVPMLRFLETL